MAEGDAAKTVQGVPTAGSIPSGAIVEREVAFEFGDMTALTIALKSPDFSTAYRVERAINVAAGTPVARMADSGTVRVDLNSASLSSPRPGLWDFFQAFFLKLAGGAFPGANRKPAD